MQQTVKEDYRTAVNGLGPNIIRSGLVGALAFLQRDKSSDAVRALFSHLAGAGVPQLVPQRDSDPAAWIPTTVRELPLDEYMPATREMLRVIQWLKLAVQATLRGE